jgi:hypothetical protein
MIMTKKCEGAMNDIETLLKTWMEVQIQDYVPPSLITVHAKAGTN